MAQDDSATFFANLYRGGEADFDAFRFLTEVEAQFKDSQVLAEVRWRLDALAQLAAQPGMDAAAGALRDRLTQIFTAGGQESEVLARLKSITDIQAPDGKTLDLRSFVRRDRRVVSEGDYRQLLGRKIGNTNTHVVNLIAYYPEAEPDLHKLSVALKGLTAKIRDQAVRTGALKQMEDSVRNLPLFGLYEDLKARFLKDWLGKFGDVGEAELEGMGPEEVQRLIIEHQRFQLTQLLKGKVKPLEMDMSEHLGLHDTLEAEFKDEDFWQGSNVAAKAAFARWIMDVVQTFGMLKGHRYAFFQSIDHPELYLLFGLGFSHLPGETEEPIRMVPYLKPFTRKGTYLLEIRSRDIGDKDAYYHELRHYTLPFLFAFDQMKNFQIRQELVTFFTTGY